MRSKTPKVTLNTQRAKCMLMENGPDADFEAVFYDGKYLQHLGKKSQSVTVNNDKKASDCSFICTYAV